VERRPLLLVQAVGAFPSTFLPEAVGIALFLAMWNHHSWQRAQLRILDSRATEKVVHREEDKAERRFGKHLACFREVVALLDGEQVERAGLGFNSMVRLASTTTTIVEMRESEDVVLEKAVTKWQAELERMWQRSVAAQEAHNGGSDTTLSAAM
jgi:hypothetical protein